MILSPGLLLTRLVAVAAMFQKDVGACSIYREGDCCDGELVEGLGLHERCHRSMAEWCGEEEGAAAQQFSGV